MISSASQTSATGLSRLLDNTISHDSITRFLTTNHFDSKSLWTSVKSLVREQENVNACLVFDDCIFEKQYTDENPLICWHWDHVKGRSTKGINLLSAFYVTQKDGQTESLGLPIMYELILKTVLYCLVKTKRETRKSPITKNKLMQTMIQQCIHNQLIFKYILADSWFALTDNMHFIQSKKKFFIFDLQNNRLAILADSATENLLKKTQWINIKSLNIPNNTPVTVWRSAVAVKRYGLSCAYNQTNSLRRPDSKTKMTKLRAYDFG